MSHETREREAGRVEQRVSEIRKRLAAATEGAWVVWEVRNGRSDDGYDVHSESGVRVAWGVFGGCIDDPHDALLIAHAPADIAWLLLELADCREEIAELRARETPAPAPLENSHSPRVSGDQRP